MLSSGRTGLTRVLAIGALVVGCTSEATRAREVTPPGVVASAPVERETSEDEAAQPSMRAGMTSSPRDAWPCALAADDGARSVFRYGERTSCRIPRSLGVFGVHGCPDRVEHTAADGAYETRAFEYDDEGRMTVFHGDVTLRYTWEGDRLASVARQHGAFDVSSYRDDGDAIVAIDENGDPREVLTLERERLVQWVEHVNGRTTTAILEWSNDRPSKLRDPGARTFLYECSAEMLRDSAGGVPPPDATMSSVPVDVRLASWTAMQAHHRRDCNAFAARRCELVADFDGDGKNDRAVKIMKRGTRLGGIAIRWGAGGVSILGAGVETRQLATDVHMEGIDLSWELVEEDLDFIQRWRAVPRSPTGFFDAGPPRAVGGGDESPAPEATGAGILFDTGDVAEVFYWDGVRWRLLMLGY